MTLPIANGVFGKGVAGAPGQAVCDWSGEAALPDATPRPRISVGKGLPTYECLNQFARTEGANDFRQACFAVRAR
ncbi:hypothetical protein sS8_5000 [Methylocaldum marinum]|uniref:Uncharacterized protein n=1 Tax=Methylocaldum marinum TaxID=1432792 RepID=A0A250KZ15_9GAMM|nr:hypothetical protein [Methylocaldum marinum]BBA36923.1 hypothetical protein sS8_5000 [Methylocaldum marinum]